MEHIGNLPPWGLGKTVHDPATAMIFPAIESGIPEALDDALDRRRRGAWHYDVLGASRLLRLELLQAAQPNRSFQDTLREVWHVWLHAGLVSGPMPSSSALAQARARLPTWALEMLFHHTAASAHLWPRHPLCPEFRLLAIDGVPLPLPRTPSNLAHFGTTRSQHGDAYYPQALAVWASHLPGFVVSSEYLGTACESDQCVSPHMLPKLLQPRDLILGDAHFGTYPNVAVIQKCEAFHLVRAPGTFLPENHRTGEGAPEDVDLLVTPTPYTRSRYREMALPQELRMRAVRLEIPARDEMNRTERAVFLTNLSRSEFPRERLATLTPLRWGEETLHNDIKTRLGLGEVRSGDPAGVRRETLAHLCLSNLLRFFLLIANPTAPWEGSFSAARTALAQANHQLRWQPHDREKIMRDMADVIRSQPLDSRPDRAEPRIRRPSKHPYPISKTPRSDWRAARKAG